MYESRIAQVRVNSAGEWKLRVRGTDIYESLYRDRHPELEPFPGAAMGHRLVELGWLPDRRAVLRVESDSMAERVMRTALAGWTPSATQKWVWVMSCYREVE